jgi:hypothetical protein
MPMKKGTDLGGIRTLEDLKRWCEVDQLTECWHCTYSLRDGLPNVRFIAPDLGIRKQFAGRRAALWLRDGHDIRSGFIAFAKRHCKSLDCVNPDHCRAGTRAEWGESQKTKGRMKHSASKVAKCRLAVRSRSKFTWEDIRTIRAAEGTNKQLAKVWGCSPSTIGQIKRHDTWRSEGLAGSSIFAMAEAA